MYIGHLSEIISLDEDSASARRAKNRNRSAKDTSTANMFTFNGT